MDYNDDVQWIYVRDEKGNVIKMQVLLVCVGDDKYNHKYVIYRNPRNRSGAVYASIYRDSGHIYPIESDEEFSDLATLIRDYFADLNNLPAEWVNGVPVDPKRENYS